MEQLSLLSLVDILKLTSMCIIFLSSLAQGDGSSRSSVVDEFGFKGGGGEPGLSENGWGVHDYDFRLTLHPPMIRALQVHNRQYVQINCSIPDDLIDLHRIDQNSTAHHNVTYILTVLSENPKIAIPLGHNYGPPNNRSEEITLKIQSNRTKSFLVQAQSIGHVMMLLRVTSFLNDWEDLSHTLAILEYRVTVLRRVRLVDQVFDWVVATVAMLNAFSIGCATDWSCLKLHLKHPSALLLANCCQLLIMPTVALAIAKALSLSPGMGLGLLYSACVPGGGVGHLMVSVIGADRTLSIAINCICTVAAMGTAPLWIFGMSRLLSTSDSYQSLFWMEMWLGIATGSYILGVLLRHTCPKAAEAVLTWFSKPFALLFTLVFITLGVYINMYMFDILNPSIFVAAALLPMLGYCIGTFVSYLTRQENGFVKTIATETTMSNCMLVLAMCKFSLPQPDADITSTIPIWVLFMSPVPFIIVSIIRKMRNVAVRRFEKQKEKQYRQFSIVSSLMNVTNVTTLSSSMSPKLSSPTDENIILIDEKVTVL